ncbi:MAG TPA: hypothetical protein VIL29_04755 [Pseudothermotoga sp.]
MENMINIISTLGFPIACVLAMGSFIYVAFKMFMAKSDKREDRLYELVADIQATNEKLLATNAGFVDVLEKYNADLSAIKADVSDIKDFLEFNKSSTNK